MSSRHPCIFAIGRSASTSKELGKARIKSSVSTCIVEHGLARRCISVTWDRRLDGFFLWGCSFSAFWVGGWAAFHEAPPYSYRYGWTCETLSTAVEGLHTGQARETLVGWAAAGEGGESQRRAQRSVANSSTNFCDQRNAYPLRWVVSGTLEWPVGRQPGSDGVR